jgi:hypothetical protein
LVASSASGAAASAVLFDAENDTAAETKDTAPDTAAAAAAA